MGRAEQTVVTDLDEPVREHVLEEATDELLGAEGAVLELVSGRLFVRESDLAIMQLWPSALKPPPNKSLQVSSVAHLST
jgi:hypothetical protein